MRADVVHSSKKKKKHGYLVTDFVPNPQMFNGIIFGSHVWNFIEIDSKYGK
jgi:hypothetical protein